MRPISSLIFMISCVCIIGALLVSAQAPSNRFAVTIPSGVIVSQTIMLECLAVTTNGTQFFFSGSLSTDRTMAYVSFTSSSCIDPNSAYQCLQQLNGVNADCYNMLNAPAASIVLIDDTQPQNQPIYDCAGTLIQTGCGENAYCSCAPGDQCNLAMGWNLCSGGSVCLFAEGSSTATCLIPQTPYFMAPTTLTDFFQVSSLFEETGLCFNILGFDSTPYLSGSNIYFSINYTGSDPAFADAQDNFLRLYSGATSAIPTDRQNCISALASPVGWSVLSGPQTDCEANQCGNSSQCPCNNADVCGFDTTSATANWNSVNCNPNFFCLAVGASEDNPETPVCTYDPLTWVFTINATNLSQVGSQLSTVLSDTSTNAPCAAFSPSSNPNLRTLAINYELTAQSIVVITAYDFSNLYFSQPAQASVVQSCQQALSAAFSASNVVSDVGCSTHCGASTNCPCEAGDQCQTSTEIFVCQSGLTCNVSDNVCEAQTTPTPTPVDSAAYVLIIINGAILPGVSFDDIAAILHVQNSIIRPSDSTSTSQIVTQCVQIATVEQTSKTTFVYRAFVANTNSCTSQSSWTQDTSLNTRMNVEAFQQQTVSSNCYDTNGAPLCGAQCTVLCSTSQSCQSNADCASGTCSRNICKESQNNSASTQAIYLISVLCLLAGTGGFF